MLYEKQTVFNNISIYGRPYEPCHITINKIDIINKDQFLKQKY